MISYENVQKALGVDIAISRKMEQAILLWSRMYTNSAPWLNKDIKSLGLPSAISTEVTRLVTMEMDINITGSARANFLAEQFDRILPNLSTYIEYACAKGGIVFKPYIDSGGIAIDFVQAGNFYPVRFNSANRVTAAIFPEFKQEGKKLYTRLEYHSLEGDRYRVINKAFVSSRAAVTMGNILQLGAEISLDTVEEWRQLEPVVEFNHADSMLFSYFKVPMANNVDVDSPLGVSVYSRATGQIRDVDEQYGATLWEFKAKETAIQATKDFFDADRFGNVRMPAGKERFYFAMNSDIEDDKGRPFFNVYSPEIRDESFFNGFNKMLQRVEFNSGLAYGTLSDPQTVEKTAEEIKASKQRSYSMVKSIQNALFMSIKEVVKIIDVWADIAGLAPVGGYEVTGSFDDSLVVDAKTEKEQDRTDVASGIMLPWEYRVKWYGETEAIARQMLSSSVANAIKTEVIQ